MDKKQPNLIRFLEYIRPYWVMILLGTIGGIIKFTIPLYQPILIKQFTDEAFLPIVKAMDNGTLTEALQSASWSKVLYSILFLLTIYILVYTPGTWIRHSQTGLAGHRAMFDLRCDVYYKVLRMNAGWFNKNHTGSIVTRLISDIELAQNLIGTAITNVVMDTLALTIVLVYLFTTDWRLALVSIVTFPIFAFSLRRSSKSLRKASKDVQDNLEHLSGNVTEKIGGSLIIHAFTRETYERKLFFKDNEKLLNANRFRIFLQTLHTTINAVLTETAPLFVWLYGGWLMITGSITFGELIAFTLYIKQLYLPVQRFTELNIVISNSLAAIDRIFEIIDLSPDITDKPDALLIKNVTGQVTFNNVCFKYNASSDDILHNVSFSVCSGEKVAFVGSSGSGKSTLVSLMPRFYDVTSGSILIDGQDVRDVTLRSLRKEIGIVLQTPVLFSGTIEDNIRYGNPRASEEEFLAACRNANVLDFISDLPDGFSTDVGERGVLLSGGQRQRLTIARAFLKDPKILILDEATSALDAESERLLQEALERLMEGRTTFLIAHRLSTIVSSDQIFVLEDGEIVEHGTHIDLLSLDGVYARLYHQQFKSAEIFKSNRLE